MILTFKVKHDRDFSEELQKARQVAEFAIEHRTFSSKDVKHLGLKSMIANQILRKYGRNKTVKRVRSIKLTIPNQGIKVDQAQQLIRVPCLKLVFHYKFPNGFEKINQIEVGADYIYVAVTVPERTPIQPQGYLGVDLNTTRHAAVVANPMTGKVWKLGKKCEHIHKKYKNHRKKLQKAGAYKLVKKVKDRERRIVRDTNHKISHTLVNLAQQAQCGLKLEQLNGIRQTAKYTRSFRYSLHSWSFYHLQQLIEYKAKLLGIPVLYVDPAYTSKTCSRCGHIEHRNDKTFACPRCGQVEHADVNAAFNIATRPSIAQSHAERDGCEGSTDTPKEAPPRTRVTSEPPRLSGGEDVRVPIQRIQKHKLPFSRASASFNR